MQAAGLQVNGLCRDVGEGANRRPLFVDFSLTVAPGEIVFVTGPSGAGKSLLLRTLACLDEAQGGSLFLDGVSPQELGLPVWRASVCYVSQSRWAFPGTPLETFTAFSAFAAQRGREHGDVRAHAAALGLDEGAVEQAWSTLSGGQAQRAQLAVALALSPRVLLLDEPTSALDPVTVLLAEEHIRHSGVSAVWVSHDPEQPRRVGGRVVRFPPGARSSAAPTPVGGTPAGSHVDLLAV